MTARSRFSVFGSLSKMPFEDRLARYEQMVAMKQGLPPYTRTYSYAEIAASMTEAGYKMSRQRVLQLLKDGRPESPDIAIRQRRALSLQARIDKWKDHDGDAAKSRVAKYTRELEELQRTA